MAAEHYHQLQPEDYEGYEQEIEYDIIADEGNYNSESSASESDCPSCMPESPLPAQVNLRCSASTFDATPCFTHENLPVGLVIDKRFQITGLLGKGSFAAAYAAKCLNNPSKEVVIKARVSTTGTSFSESLASELDVYQKLGAYEQQVGIPCLYSAGVHNLVPATGAPKPVHVSYLAIQRLGPSIWSLRNWQPEREQVLYVGLGMLKALASIHAKGYIHKDVKTDNFCINRNKLDNVYAIDYGFARPAYGWYDFKVYNTPHASFWGTPNYASMASLLRYPQTPRDDLEALVYCLLELESEGCYLPWNLTTNSEAAAGWTDEQLQRMNQDKWRVWNHACKDGLVPEYLQAMFYYIHGLEPFHVPDYSYVLSILECELVRQQLPSKPTPRRFRAWPAADTRYDHERVTDMLLRELHTAASAVLDDACYAAGSSAATETAAADAHAALESEEQQQHQQQQGHKRQAAYVAESFATDSMGGTNCSVDAGGYNVDLNGAGLSLGLEDDDEVDSMCLSPQCKRQRVTAAALVVGTEPGKHVDMLPAAGLTAMFEEGSQPEE